MNNRILIAVSGLSPQILTETLYALAVKAEQKWIPDEIHLITTSRGKEHAALNLLSGRGGFHQLCRDYKLPAIAFDAERHIHLIEDAAGRPLEDIRTPEDNEAAADTITKWIRELTQDENSEVHVSIAGGRKTMGYYAGYALSLFGRDQDRLSHVLASAPYESHREFFYPTPYEHVIHTDGPDKRTVDCRQAEVWLADIPFVRLRDGVQAPLLSGDASFSATVKAVLRPLPTKLTFVPAKRTVIFGDKAVKLTDAPYGLYAWMARRCKEGLPPLVINRKGAAGKDLEMLLDEYRRLDPQLLGKLAQVERALATGIESGWFSPIRSNLHKKLTSALGSRLAEGYFIQRLPGSVGKSPYALRLAPESIDMGDESSR
ncbi:CRISPR-associated ring nuclease Csm6 [Azonexus sp.]|uniref:CRISPR-associated ring nuclease Csm6 n=1 Tax=Azonexus sp. TaxID=1872668 RepID=UPI0035B376F6